MKLKTNKSAFKRVKITKNTIQRKKAGKAHLLRHKTTKQLRHLSQPDQISKSDLSTYKFLIPYHI